MAPRQNGAPQQGEQTLPIHGGPPRGGRGGFAPRGQGNGFQAQNQSPNGNHMRGRGGAQDFVPRGRGGFKGNRGGFTVIDNTDPTEGVVANNPSFRPQNYSGVPPPASLDARGGRGRGRGRGGFRGRGGPRGGGAPPAAQE
jgi:5'-3' exoribonuclease 1